MAVDVDRDQGVATPEQRCEEADLAWPSTLAAELSHKPAVDREQLEREAPTVAHENVAVRQSRCPSDLGEHVVRIGLTFTDGHERRRVDCPAGGRLCDGG